MLTSWANNHDKKYSKSLQPDFGWDQCTDWPPHPILGPEGITWPRLCPSLLTDQTVHIAGHRLRLKECLGLLYCHSFLWLDEKTRNRLLIKSSNNNTSHKEEFKVNLQTMWNNITEIITLQGFWNELKGKWT